MPFTYDDIPELCVACSADLEEQESCVIHKPSADADEQALCDGCWEKRVPDATYDDNNIHYGYCCDCYEWHPWEGCAPVMMGQCDGCGKENICSNCSAYNEDLGEQHCEECQERAEEEAAEDEEPAEPAGPPPPQLSYRQTVEHRVGSVSISVELSAATQAELDAEVAKLRAALGI